MDTVREVQAHLVSAAAAAGSEATHLTAHLFGANNVRETTNKSNGDNSQTRGGRFGVLLSNTSGRVRSPFPAFFASQTSNITGKSTPPASPSKIIRSALRRRSSPRPPLTKQSSLTGGGGSGPSVIESILNTPTRLTNITANNNNNAGTDGTGDKGGTIEAQLNRRTARANALGGGRKPSVLANALFEHLLPRRMPRPFSGIGSSGGGGVHGGGGGGMRGMMKTALIQRMTLSSSSARNILGGRKEGLGVRFKKTEIGGLEIVDEAPNNNSTMTLVESRRVGSVDSGHHHRHSIVSNSSQRAEYDEQCEDLELVPTKFGMLNPRLYKGYVPGDDDDIDFPDDHIGRIWFALKYVQSNEQLLVKVHAIRNLPSRTSGSAGVGTQCDPQVKVCLLPDDRRELHTTAKFRNCNPRFYESFVFPVQAAEMPERTLRLTVCDAGNQFKIIGYGLYQFKHFDSKRDFEVAKVFRDLTPLAELKEEKPLPELFVALQYNEQRETLTVTVYHGRHFSSFILPADEDLSAANNDGKAAELSSSLTEHDSNLNDSTVRLPRMLVKIELFYGGRSVKSKETAAVEGCDCPTFNESFQFKVKQRQIDISSVHIIVERRKFTRKQRSAAAAAASKSLSPPDVKNAFAAAAARRKSHHHIVAHDKTLGRLVLGGFMFARGKCCTHWEQMRELGRQQVQMWHTFS